MSEESCVRKVCRRKFYTKKIYLSQFSFYTCAFHCRYHKDSFNTNINIY